MIADTGNPSAHQPTIGTSQSNRSQPAGNARKRNRAVTSEGYVRVRPTGAAVVFGR